MNIEEIEDFRDKGNPLKNKKKIRINLIIIILGSILVNLGFIGKLLPLNRIIIEGEQYYSMVDRDINSVWEKDNELVLVYGYSPDTYDSYDKVTGTTIYSIELDNLFDTEDYSSFDSGLSDIGFNKLSIFLYRILIWIRIIGVLVIVTGISRFFINPRRTISGQEMATKESESSELAIELTRIHRH